ncbi:transposase [Poseidonocella sp. HB161398]|uniref:transposase n=1 Tax=Poseidonocella sp. HB161398 TaxID=2320855 RepID=UPI003511F66A
MPGAGPTGAMAIHACAPPLETFGSGRDVAAWSGHAPKQMSTGGKPKLGRPSRMRQRDIRRLQSIGAMGVARWAIRKGAPTGSWLEHMMARKPRLPVAMALASKMHECSGLWRPRKRIPRFGSPGLTGKGQRATPAV